MERRFVTLKNDGLSVETREDGTAVVAGYAAVFYRKDDPGSEYNLWDNVYERIVPGAFDRALSEGDDVRALFNHDPNHVLGRTSSGTLRLETNRRGLRYEIDTPDTQTGRDLAASIRRGDISGSSFAFQVDDEAWCKEENREVREIRSVRMFDVGPVTFPAYKSTTTGIRSEELAEIRSSYEAWQESEAQPKKPWNLGLAKAKIAIEEASA